MATLELVEMHGEKVNILEDPYWDVQLLVKRLKEELERTNKNSVERSPRSIARYNHFLGSAKLLRIYDCSVVNPHRQLKAIKCLICALRQLSIETVVDNIHDTLN